MSHFCTHCPFLYIFALTALSSQRGQKRGRWERWRWRPASRCRPSSQGPRLSPGLANPPEFPRFSPDSRVQLPPAAACERPYSRPSRRGRWRRNSWSMVGELASIWSPPSRKSRRSTAAAVFEAPEPLPLPARDAWIFRPLSGSRSRGYGQCMPAQGSGRDQRGWGTAEMPAPIAHAAAERPMVPRPLRLTLLCLPCARRVARRYAYTALSNAERRGAPGAYRKLTGAYRGAEQCPCNGRLRTM